MAYGLKFRCGEPRRSALLAILGIAHLWTSSTAAATETAAARADALAPYVELDVPGGAGPHPLAVLMPGCLGWRAHHDKWRDDLRDRGYATLYIDSFGANGIEDRGTLQREVCTGQRVPGAQRAGDLIAVIARVWERPDILAAQTIFFGWSHGGWTAMDFLIMGASAAGAPNVSPMPPIEIANVRAAFLLYPYCGLGSLSGDDGFPSATKTIIFHGSADVITDPGQCRARAKKLRAAGADIDFVSLHKAGHWFDNHAVQTTYDAGAAGRANTLINGALEELGLQ